MSNQIFKLEELSSSDLNALDRNKTLFVITVSPIENHGGHVPLGMDIIEGNAIKNGIIKQFSQDKADWNIVCCPDLSVGFNTFPGTGSIDIRQKVVRDLLFDYFSSLGKKGFKYVFVSGFHGGPRHVVAIDEVSDLLYKKYKMKIVAPFGYVFTRVVKGKMELPHPELNELFKKNNLDLHGGMFETSFMLHVRPDLVKEYKNLPTADLKVKNPIKKVLELRNAFKFGYIGVPSKAEERIGELILNDSIKVFYEILIKSMEDDKYFNSIKGLNSSKFFMKTNFTRNLLVTTFLSLSGIGMYFANNYIKNSKK